MRLSNFDLGEMAERSIAAVLKTVDCNRSGGSNPSLSAERKIIASHRGAIFILGLMVPFEGLDNS